MTDVWGANTFPVRKYNSRAFYLKVRRSRLFRFFRRFPQINVGGDSARIPFMEHTSRESRVALPPKGRLRHYQYTLHQHHQDPNPYPWPIPEQFRATIAWLGDRPNFQEEAGPANAQGAAQGDKGRDGVVEDMTDLLDFFIGGDWAPRPWSSKFVNLSLSYLLFLVFCYFICCDDCLKKKKKHTRGLFFFFLSTLWFLMV